MFADLLKLGLKPGPAVSFPEGLFTDETGRSVPVVPVQLAENPRPCRQLYLGETIVAHLRRIRLRGSWAPVLCTETECCRLLYGAPPLPELVSIEATKPLGLSPLTPAQAQLAEQLGIPLCQLHGGQVLLSPGEAVLSFRAEAKLLRSKLPERLRSALDYLSPVVAKFGQDRSLAALYLYYPCEQHQALTEWLLSLPHPGFLVMLLPSHFDKNGHLHVENLHRYRRVGDFPQGMLDPKLSMIVCQIRRRSHWLPPGSYRCFERPAERGYRLVWLPTDRPVRYSLMQVIASIPPSLPEQHVMLGYLAALARQHPELIDATLAYALFVLRQADLSATKVAEVLHELELLLKQNL
ncbi:MAG: hypothetical protein NZ482_03630 [Gloeomargarita sp. SKYG98]|nr:hypothetical protein [Gloeomargarita sp. SKYG98]